MTAIQLSLIKLGDDKSKFKFRMYSNARAPELLLFIIRSLGRRDREESFSKNQHKVEAFKFIGQVKNFGPVTSSVRGRVQTVWDVRVSDSGIPVP